MIFITEISLTYTTDRSNCDWHSCLFSMHSLTVHVFINVWCSCRIMLRVLCVLCVAHTVYSRPIADTALLRALTLLQMTSLPLWTIVLVHRNRAMHRFVNFCLHITPVTACTLSTLSANFRHIDIVLLFSISMLYTNTSHTIRAQHTLGIHYLSLCIWPSFLSVPLCPKRGRFVYQPRADGIG